MKGQHRQHIGVQLTGLATTEAPLQIQAVKVEMAYRQRPGRISYPVSQSKCVRHFMNDYAWLRILNLQYFNFLYMTLFQAIVAIGIRATARKKNDASKSRCWSYFHGHFVPVQVIPGLKHPGEGGLFLIRVFLHQKPKLKIGVAWEPPYLLGPDTRPGTIHRCYPRTVNSSPSIGVGDVVSMV